jgi:lipopolysaccharide/colanic/teichoic acid biosynthesis glycosyltransferase
MGQTNFKFPNPAPPDQRLNNRDFALRSGQLPTLSERLLSQEAFHAMLTLERRRAERSKNPFILLLVDTHLIHKNGNSASFFERLTSVASGSTRETDVVGWYETANTLGIIFTETTLTEDPSVAEILRAKIIVGLQNALGEEVTSKLIITVHVFPQDVGRKLGTHSGDAEIYSDMTAKSAKKRIPMVVKRAIDVLGSGLLLLILSPILATVALLIKLSSPGPVIFEQERVGQFGRRFKCLKFRSMYANNDPKIHREYVQSFIAGKPDGRANNEASAPVYKLTNDPRVTPIGRFIRKTSLDEFPQFWNVLRGEMSLVGPRPPVPYEFDVYDCWHRRRVLEVKPGVTGLWQVSGRSRTSFDDMVRLDVRYSQTWSLWLDLRILLATPRAVFMGDGAF